MEIILKQRKQHKLGAIATRYVLISSAASKFAVEKQIRIESKACFSMQLKKGKGCLTSEVVFKDDKMPKQFANRP